MKKFNLAEAANDKKLGLALHDLVREGRAMNLDPIKVSAVLGIMGEIINDLMDEIEQLKINTPASQKNKNTSLKKRGRPHKLTSVKK